MDRIKSAYEIAMEKAEEISKETSIDEDRLERREELKPLLAQFYNEEIDVDQLWKKLQDRDKSLLVEAQVMVLESLGLRTSEEEFKKRKKVILGIEQLKGDGQTSRIENSLTKLRQLQQRYSNDRNRIEEQLEREMNNSEMQLKQVQTDDGRTVMKMEPGVDRETQQKYKKAISQTEAQYSERFNMLIQDIKTSF